ncbi:hypothetical protein V7S43_010134 [Phytophthora oleae]|uniref:HAT C-terminal dimerisation domain-containing protein n=1 Tax=Phytophthora oleae TaxID=2107226 RepID=A0ABD3FDY1_9STRA
MPVPTRWYSVHACLHSVLNSQELLEKLFLSSDYEYFRDRYRATAASRKKLCYITELVRDNGFWSGLRTIVRLLDPIITALRELEADNVFVSGVYRWFRWLRYHTSYGVTSPEEEFESEQEQSHLPRSELGSVPPDPSGIDLISNTTERLASNGSEPTNNELRGETTDDESGGGEYQNVAALPLSELQQVFREKIKTRWNYVHTNAMGIAFLLDPAEDLEDFVGSDDDNVENEVCEMAERCGILTPTRGIPKLVAEILAFKSAKRQGGEEMRLKYSESSPRDYWNALKVTKYPLLKKITDIVFAVPTLSVASERAWSIMDHIHSKRRNRLSVEKVEMVAYIYINHGTIAGDAADAVDLARHQSCLESVEVED